MIPIEASGSRSTLELTKKQVAMWGVLRRSVQAGGVRLETDTRLARTGAPGSVQLTVFAHTGLVVFWRSLSYGVWPPSPPWGRL